MVIAGSSTFTVEVQIHGNLDSAWYTLIHL